MSVIQRITRLFQADLHGVLDNLEEPAAMLKQAVREMQAEIADGEAQLQALGRRVQQLTQTCQTLAATIADCEAQTEFCLSVGNDALAKAQLRKQLEAQQCLQSMEKQRGVVQDEYAEAHSELLSRQDKLKSVLDKMALFTGSSGDGELPLEPARSAVVSQDDVELAFLQAKRRYAETQPVGGGQP